MLVCAGKIIFAKFLYYLLNLCLIFQAAPPNGQFFHCQVHGLQKVSYETHSCSRVPLLLYVNTTALRWSPKFLLTMQTQTILLHFRAICKLFLHKNLFSSQLLSARAHLCSLQLARHSPCKESHIWHKTSASSTTWNV